MLQDKVSTLTRRHSEHGRANHEQRLFKTKPQKFGPYTKLSSKDEFLMNLKKLCLHLAVFALKLFDSWMLGIAEYYNWFIYMPDMDQQPQQKDTEVLKTYLGE